MFEQVANRDRFQTTPLTFIGNGLGETHERGVFGEHFVVERELTPVHEPEDRNGRDWLRYAGDAELTFGADGFGLSLVGVAKTGE